ncbi:hypothetical protein GCM10010124_30680 [Pilimelia terevasa]|uniref:Uncharacterized protein n=1 Tax=Pilimelia terevasa TaxID=53372 RepID=A0A8J3BT09_9ACTN|nr:hypothetical protein [Pilimelia terevasa]GGK35874.1 hypothetical protein GCM10010124_30680 [Pilimelia terevasa]
MSLFPLLEVTMFAVIAAVLFGLALLLQLIGAALGPLTPTALMLAGLLCVALSMAGIGSGLRR